MRISRKKVLSLSTNLRSRFEEYDALLQRGIDEIPAVMEKKGIKTLMGLTKDDLVAKFVNIKEQTTVAIKGSLIMLDLLLGDSDILKDPSLKMVISQAEKELDHLVESTTLLKKTLALCANNQYHIFNNNKGETK